MPRPARRTGTRIGWAKLAAAMGLMLAASGCVSSYETACAAAGKTQGSAEFENCVQQRTQMAYEDRTRHLKYGSGG